MSSPLADALVTLWLLFASQVSGLPIPRNAPHPIVEFVQNLPQGMDGTTDIQTGRIRLQDRDRSGSETGCLLAHELTHWLQVQNQWRFSCTDDSEPAAYRVEAICFSKFGLTDGTRWAWEQAAKHGCRRP